MIGLNWIIVPPDGMSWDRFDEWYLGSHTKFGKRSPGIVRYSISRAFTGQPGVAAGTVYRVAQEYWNDWDDLEKSWNSPSAFATLGDGLVHIGADPAINPAISLGEDVQLPVAVPAQFSTVRRGYRGSPDGTHVKLLAFGFAADPTRLASWYRQACESLGEDQAVREHIFGTRLGRTLQIGYLASIPAPGQLSYDWNLELWFDDRPQAEEFLRSRPFLKAWTELKARSSGVLAALVRSQEMLVSMDPVDHSEA